MHEIELTGLDGGDLLGFLAALGTLRVLSVGNCQVRMWWTDASGSWRPVIQDPEIENEESLVELVASLVCGESSVNAAWSIGEDLTLGRADFRACLEEHARMGGLRQRAAVDFLAAFGSDAYGSGPKKEQMSDTGFRTMSGAGHQHFLGFMKELARATDREHIRRCLLEPWDYADGRPSMRWSWTDYRPHALRASDPSSDPIRTMRGANRLAVEALPLFPTIPTDKRVRTVAFQDRNRETEVTWPVWTCAVDVRTAQSLVGLEELQKADPAECSRVLIRRGIAQVFRARRFTDGKYRNFSMAKALI